MRIAAWWIYCAVISLLAVPTLAAQRPRFTLACAPDNDLYRTLKAGGFNPERRAMPAEAVAAAKPGSAVLLLADEYPSRALSFSPDLFHQAQAKKLRLYVEYADSIPGLSFAPARKTAWERIVVNRDGLGRELPRGQLLVAHECHVLPVMVENPLLVLARVAGYNRAIYGIPKTAQPVLFTLEQGRVLVATTQLSRFVTGRFAPTREWRALWGYILRTLSGAELGELGWEPRVGPSYGPTEPLPRRAEQKAFALASRWYFESHLLVPESRSREISRLLKEGNEVLDVVPAQLGVGDGRFGILEGYASNIGRDGHQPQRTVVRADCQAETAMVLALDWALNGNRRSRSTASNLLDFVYFASDLCQGERGNPRHPAYGLIGWGSTAPAWTVANYGDDNARTMLATLLAAACLRSDRWDEPLLRGLLANLRTTGKLGFRGDRIDMPQLERHGWSYYHDAATVNFSPHFEAYNWACFLWAYRHTGEPEFLAKAKSAIRMTMEAFPAKWRWNDNSERARMLLCLAWLIQVEDTPEHRRWLGLILEDLLGLQHATGALPERFRGGGLASHYQVPASNEAYGTTETPLLQENGDPVSDQLYVSGFALLGLHEAAAVLRDPRVQAAEEGLGEYLCRIQIRSPGLPYLHGTWFRAFDFERWEPWASSGDAGWGAWCTEAGWAQAWTAATMGLRLQRASLWQLSAETGIGKRMGTVRQQLFQNRGGSWAETSVTPNR